LTRVDLLLSAIGLKVVEFFEESSLLVMELFVGDALAANSLITFVTLHNFNIPMSGRNSSEILRVNCHFVTSKGNNSAKDETCEQE